MSPHQRSLVGRTSIAKTQTWSPSRVVSALALVSLAAGIACESSTGLDDSIEIGIGAPETPQFVVARELDEVPVFRCEVPFTASAAGGGAARWDGVTFVRYVGTDWSVPYDTAFVSEEEVGGVWDADTIRSGQVMQSVWTFSGGVPFRIRAVFYFLEKGRSRRRSASVVFTCGPAPNQNGPAPGLQVLEVRTSDPVPEAGDTLFVHYTASSAARIQRSAVLVRGAFAAAQWIPEPLVESVDRTLKFVIPRQASMDSIIRLIVMADDGAGRHPELNIATTIRVQDVSPPTLVSVWTLGGLRATNTVADFYVRAHDAQDLHRIVWEVGGSAPYTDSVTIGDEPFDHTELIGIRVPISWLGTSPPITWTVRDRAGLSSNSITTPAAAYEVYETVSGAVAQGDYGMPGGAVGHVGDVVFDSKRNLLLTAHAFQGYLGAMDLTTMLPRTAIAIPGGAHSLDLSPGGDSVLIGQRVNAEIPIVDLRTFTLAAPLALPVLDSIGTSAAGVAPRPAGVRVMANGTVVVRTHYSSAAGDNTLTVDLATRVARVRPDARPGAAYVEPWWPRMQLLPGRSDLVMFDPTCARIYHQATDDFSGCAASSPAPSTGIAIRPDGQRFLVGGRLFDGALAQIGAMSEVHYAILLPDGEHIIATVDGTVQKIRLSDGKPVKRLEVGSAGLDRLLLLPDGHTILAFASGAGKVFRIDATALLN